MKYKILPGSLEMDGTVVTAGVHTGPEDWKQENLRFVRIDWSEHKDVKNVGDLLAHAYENSEGCIINGDFRMKT